MSDTDGAFPLLLQRARERVRSAVAELVKTYTPVLLAAIRRQLENVKLLRRLYDPEDFAQEVWLAFFKRSLDKNHFATPRDLAAFLAKAGVNRVRNMEWRYLHVRKRNLACDVSLDALGRSGADRECVTQAAGPDRVAAARDEWEQFLRCQPESARPALARFGEDWTVRSCAGELGLSESTLKRIKACAVAVAQGCADDTTESKPIN